jgi:hypothetical protein
MEQESKEPEVNQSEVKQKVTMSETILKSKREREAKGIEYKIRLTVTRIKKT